jgi:hypothetical protein
MRCRNMPWASGKPPRRVTELLLPEFLLVVGDD